MKLKKRIKRFKKRHQPKLEKMFIVMALVFSFVFPQHSLAAEAARQEINIDEAIEYVESLELEIEFTDDSEIMVEIPVLSSVVDQEVSLPKIKNKVISSSYHYITAYNSLPGQTDDTPCITANNFNVCEHGIEDTIAINSLRFGTKVKIPELFGDRIFIVRDRMNKRYTTRIDVWMKSYEDAKKFGIKYARIEIVK
jgi:3D (Asp-Asp-Asp) domain-containing protein